VLTVLNPAPTVLRQSGGRTGTSQLSPLRRAKTTLNCAFLYDHGIGAEREPTLVGTSDEFVLERIIRCLVGDAARLVDQFRERFRGACGKAR
jgi:hypothetical protein